MNLISVSPCSPNPCLNDGSCTVDIYGEAVCTCNGEWTGCDCSSKYTLKFYHTSLLCDMVGMILYNQRWPPSQDTHALPPSQDTVYIEFLFLFHTCFATITGHSIY